MLRIDFRYDHRYIRCPSVCRIVGNNRCFGLCVIFFNLFDFFFGHVNGTEYKIHFGSNLFYLVDIHDNYLLYLFRHRGIHFPAIPYCFFIGLACGTWACCNCCYLEPGMILKQRDKSLSNHTCST